MRLLGEAHRLTQHHKPGAHARLGQFLTFLINPYRTSFTYEDHTGARRGAVTFSSRVALARRGAFTALRDQGLGYEEIGDLVGLTKTGVQATFERAAGTRARQKRITLADAARLEQAKAVTVPVAPLTDQSRRGN